MKTKKQLQELGFIFTSLDGGAYYVANTVRGYSDNAKTEKTLINRINKAFAFDVEEPSILTTSTYFYKPAMSSKQRRSNEAKRLGAVQNFLERLKFDVNNDGKRINSTFNSEKLGTITVAFHYSESCKNIYKHLDIRVNDQISNIRTLRKLYL